MLLFIYCKIYSDLNVGLMNIWAKGFAKEFLLNVTMLPSCQNNMNLVHFKKVLQPNCFRKPLSSSKNNFLTFSSLYYKKIYISVL